RHRRSSHRRARSPAAAQSSRPWRSSGTRRPAISQLRRGRTCNRSHLPGSIVLLSTLALLPALSGPLLPVSALAQTATPGGGLLPSWNDGPAKQAILDFVRGTTDRSSPSFVSAEDRIAVFDQDGTLWVEHPMYTQVVYCLERVPAVVVKRPELRN